jgi:hypothetical protein
VATPVKSPPTWQSKGSVGGTFYQLENAAQAVCSSGWRVVYFVIPTIVKTF